TRCTPAHHPPPIRDRKTESRHTRDGEGFFSRLLVPLRGSIAVASRWGRRSTCASAALCGWSGVTHSISACAVIGCPESFQERREARTYEPPRARFIPAVMHHAPALPAAMP